MAEAARDNDETISNQSGDTFLLNSGDEADLEDFVESNRRTFPAFDLLNAEAENNASTTPNNVSTTDTNASYATIAAPRVSVQENTPTRSANYRGEFYLTSFERANFHRENVTPERPCTAYFNSGIFADSNAVFEALRTQGFQTEAIRCLQKKPTGDMLITFASAQLKNAFLEKNVMQIRHRRFAINDEDRQLTYLNIYDAPHELSDSALVRRLEQYCEVIHIRRGRYPNNRSIFNGNRHYRVRRHAAIPSYLRFGKFLVRLSHDGQDHTCRKCNRLGHFANDCPNTFCFNCEELGHKADVCPSAELCCICKHHSHRARFCPYSWHRRPSPPGTPTQSTPPQAENHEPAHDESQPVPEQTSLLPATTDVSPPTDVPPPTDDPPVAEDPVPTSESATDLDTSQILNSEGLFALRRLFSDDDEDLESVPPDSSGSSDESSDDDDDDGDDGKTTNTDDHGNSDPEMDVESQPLFSSESQPLVSSESTPAPEQERSSFGPMRSARRLSGRRQPAPMPEPLQALHRIVTAPAPVPSGRTSRAAVDPAAPPPPPPPPPDHGNVDPPSSDHGNVDPGSIT